MFCTDTIARGKYIKIKLSLCHRPSLDIAVLANLSLSDITNITKKTNDNMKEIIPIPPVTVLPFFKESTAISNGTKRKSIKPSAEPAPCILEAVVTLFFVSFTLKNAVKIHAPIPNTAIKEIRIIVIQPDVE